MTNADIEAIRENATRCALGHYKQTTKTAQVLAALWTLTSLTAEMALRLPEPKKRGKR